MKIITNKLFVCFITTLIVNTPLTLANTTDNESSNNEHKQTYSNQLPYDDIKSGSLFYKSPNGYFASAIQNSDYSVEVNGLLARVKLSQTFTNTSDEWLEAVYVFPLSEDAAVDAMTMEVGERKITGKIKEKQQAKKLYTEAKRQGKKAGLVSQQRPNMFTTKVANIAPKTSVKVSLSYFQSVRYEDETFSFRLPLTITPRFIPSPEYKLENPLEKAPSELKELKAISVNNQHGWAINNARVPDANEITPFQTRNSKGQRATINVKINSGLAISNLSSTYHRITKRQKENRWNISLTDPKILMDRDFEITWQLSQGNKPEAAFFKESDDEFEYALLMLMPPNAQQSEVINKEVVYIIDTSGSMGGVAIRQAKLALIDIIEKLHPNDRFNIIEFNSSANQLFTSSLIANKGNRLSAINWIKRLSANGGTNMAPALSLALSNQSETILHKQIIFITDGAIGNEEELFSLIENKINDTRIHTVGIGSAPNSYFMSKVAEVGRGSYRYIGKVDEVQQKMAELFKDINSPLMTNIQLNWQFNSKPQLEYFPKHLPDLYEGQPLMISAKWKKNTIQSVEAKGNLAKQKWKQKLLIKPETNTISEKTGVSTWFARQKLKHLNDLHRQSFGDDKEKLKIQITELALKHSLLSSFTSFVAIEEVTSRPKEETLKSRSVPNLMPKGSTQAIPLPKTALGLHSYLYLGSAMLLFSLALMLMSTINLKTWLRFGTKRAN